MSTPRMTKAEQREARATAKQAAAARAERQRRIAVVAVSALVVVIFGGVAALALASGGGDSTAGGKYSASKEAFVLPGLLDANQTVSLSEHQGRPVVVNFFASWCVYCNEELPGFVQVAKATSGQVDFIGVDTGDPGDGAAMARRFDLSGAGFDLAEDIGADPPSDLWLSYGSQGLPVTAFYDASGTLVDFSGGMLTQEQLEDRITTIFGVEVDAADATELGAPVIPLIPRGAYELLAGNQEDPTFVAVDLRPADQYRGGHLPGAINLEYPSTGFDEAVAALDTAGSYFLYDAAGAVSKKAAEAMHEVGFRHVYDIEGGIAAWEQSGLPTTQ